MQRPISSGHFPLLDTMWWLIALLFVFPQALCVCTCDALTFFLLNFLHPTVCACTRGSYFCVILVSCLFVRETFYLPMSQRLDFYFYASVWLQIAGSFDVHECTRKTIYTKDLFSCTLLCAFE